MISYRPFILKQILKTVSKTDESAKAEEEVTLTLPGDGGYEVVYSKLIYASKPEYDPLQGNQSTRLKKIQGS